MPLDSTHRCWVEINLAKLQKNLATIRNWLPDSVQYISVVKANAYGHGIKGIVTSLLKGGVDAYAVANVKEAAVIRSLSSTASILVLSPLLKEEDSCLLEYDLTPTVSSLDEINRFNQLAKESKKNLKVQFKIDTGMGRLGIWHEWANSFYQEIKRAEFLDLVGTYTHFPLAGYDDSYTQKQRELFAEVLKSMDGLDVEKLQIHSDKSASIQSFDSNSVFNAVRVGILQFGILPSSETLPKGLEVEPVLSFKSRISLIKALPKGSTVSYGRTHALNRPSRIAVISAGYADGISIGLSNRGQVIIRGRRCPIIGRVTMDQTIIDITDYPEVQVGDEVTFIGNDGKERISFKEWSLWSNTIEWDVLCSITERVTRRYIE